ncbi:MAG: hypothetical protein NVS3B3_18200 [Aquirhabdus sp.]
MASINKTELWRELEATDEAFVRQKHATGGYGQAKGKLVGLWIATKDAGRQAELAVAEVRAARTTAFWTNVGAIATATGVFVVLIIALLPKIHS